MIVIIPASKLQSIMPPHVLKFSERLLVCLTDDADSVVVMGLTQYCLTMRRREGGRHAKLWRAQHVPSRTVHPTQTAQ